MNEFAAGKPPGKLPKAASGKLPKVKPDTPKPLDAAPKPSGKPSMDEKYHCPDTLTIKKSTVPGAGKGVFAIKTIPKGTVLGEYKGVYLSPEQFHDIDDATYVWALYDKNYNIVMYIDARIRKKSNWCRFVNCSRTESMASVETLQRGIKLFYTTSRKIEKGEELFVWYGDEYAAKLFGRIEKQELKKRPV